jgi:hypothetical protein
MRARVLAAAALAVVSIAAGCGGGGENGGGDLLTSEEFVQQADGLCADANQQIGALSEPQNVQELATYAAEALSISEQTLDALGELSPPEDLQAQYDRALELLDEQNAIGRQIVDAAEEGDTARIEELSAQAEALEAETDQIAVDLGLQTCGSESEN